ncbi:hypothetical protein CFter6_4288 [Collimonas fungivorans]|uniref:Uncharacterized protein n=1 Tax=Collimonas fungivorans TaxID=158899 RepID=A0A127PGM4_9BURK|nr:hypothetical protein CFter6_4288 [Collimonas fungivorans]
MFVFLSNNMFGYSMYFIHSAVFSPSRNPQCLARKAKGGKDTPQAVAMNHWQ